MLEVFTYKNLILTSFCVLKVEGQYPVTFTITLLQCNSWPAIIFFFKLVWFPYNSSRYFERQMHSIFHVYRSSVHCFKRLFLLLLEIQK